MLSSTLRTGNRLAIGRTLRQPSISAKLAPSFRFATVQHLTTRLMSHSAGESTIRPEADKVLQDIADYVHHYKVKSDLAFETARLCLIDTIGCGLEALRFPECTKLLGPVVEGTIVPNGVLFFSLGDQLFTYDRNPRTWYKLRARSNSWRVQHRCCNSMARFQRLLPGC